MNSAGGERLVDNGPEGFGDLDCIFCPSTSDEMDPMANIGRGKLGWTTTRGLLELRTVFGAKSGDSRGVDTHSGCNRVGRMACIKPSENSVFLGSREGSHDDSGGKQDVCKLFQAQT